MESSWKFRAAHLDSEDLGMFFINLGHLNQFSKIKYYFKIN
jgi:hypothetical protein